MNKNEEMATAPAPGAVSIEMLLQALYLAVLQREITEKELVARLESIKDLDKTQLVNLVRSFLLSSEFVRKFDELATVQPMLQKMSFRYSAGKLRSVALVAVFNEAWLPFCLAVADYLYEEFSLQTVLLTYSPFHRAYDADIFCAAVIQTVNVYDIDKITENFNPDLLVVHSFGSKSETTALLNRFPYSPLMVYGDAYKNTVSNYFDSIRPVYQSLMFGFDDGSTANSTPNGLLNKVLSSAPVLKYRNILAGYHPFDNADPEAEPDNYAVFYLRYWGTGAYESLSDESIVECWFQTVVKNMASGTVLIVKNDPRVKLSLYELFINRLIHQRISVLTFADYMHRIGLSDSTMEMLPVEYFYSKGLLCNAAAHFVLDSSLSYSIAVEKNMRRPLRIYIGPDADAFKKFNCQVAVDNIRFGVKLFSNGLLNSSEVVGIREIGVSDHWPRCFELT